jgi:hypothetical protein
MTRLASLAGLMRGGQGGQTNATRGF